MHAPAKTKAQQFFDTANAAIARTHAQQLFDAANAALAHGDAAVAEEYLLAARDEDPGNTDVIMRTADLAFARRQYPVAATLVRQVVALRPRDATAWAQLGSALWRCERYEESAKALDEALRLEPNHWLVQQNLGLWHYFVGDPEQAVSHLARALELAPNNPWVRSDHAHAVLKTGELQRGLELFEARWGTIPRGPVHDCGLPEWGGGVCADDVILLHAEQGFGDTIQFVRFVPMIREQGEFRYVIFVGPLPLKRLIEGQCEVEEYVDQADVGGVVRAIRRANCHSPLISAVAQLDFGYDDLPAPKPYLAVTPSPRDLRAGGAVLAVGLVWAASVGHDRSRQRSVSILDLLPFAEVPGVRLWSLQMAPFAREAVDTGADLVVSDATGIVMDFADTAALVQSLDAIVSVDTSVVHLAGALGRRCFMLNPLNSCWRWARGAKPWYGDVVTLHDQGEDLSWAGAIQEIKNELVLMASKARR